MYILVSASTSSCRKEPKPDCWDGSCCDQDKNRYQYIKYLDNASVDLSGPPEFSGWGLVLKEGVKIGQKTTVSAILICDNCIEKVKQLSPTFTKETALNPPYSYRVWGKIVEDKLSTSLTGLPILSIYVDRIEKVQ
jgi:hypothetical protein